MNQRSALTPKAALICWTIRDLQRRGTAVIYASHYMEEVQTLCSRAAIIDHGRLVAYGKIPELLRQIPLEVELRLALTTDTASLGLDDIASVSVEGTESVLRITADDSTSEATLNRHVTTALNRLAERSVPVRSIRTQEPNLERLFLKLTGHTLRD